MKQWQVDALRAIESAAQRAKKQVLTTADNNYDNVHGEIDVWLSKRDVGVNGYGETVHSTFSIKLYEPFYASVKQ